MNVTYCFDSIDWLTDGCSVNSVTGGRLDKSLLVHFNARTDAHTHTDRHSVLLFDFGILKTSIFESFSICTFQFMRYIKSTCLLVFVPSRILRQTHVWDSVDKCKGCLFLFDASPSSQVLNLISLCCDLYFSWRGRTFSWFRVFSRSFKCIMCVCVLVCMFTCIRWLFRTLLPHWHTVAVIDNWLAPAIHLPTGAHFCHYCRYSFSLLLHTLCVCVISSDFAC